MNAELRAKLTQFLLDSPSDDAHRNAHLRAFLEGMDAEEQAASIRRSYYELIDFAQIVLDLVADQPELREQIRAGWLALEFDRVTAGLDG